MTIHRVFHRSHSQAGMWTAACAAVLAFMAFAGLASAQDIFTSGHGDVGVGYDDALNEFEPHWHLGAGAIVNGNPLPVEEEYEPGALITRTSATRSSPTGAASILGVSDGTGIWATGSTTYPPNLGFATEELDPLDWTGPITVTFNPGSSTMPSLSAEFGLYTTNIAGTTVVDRIFSTFAPGATDFANSFTINPDDHLHFQWGFTELGQYDLSFTWSGTHAIDGIISTEATFSVQAVPEPSTIAMLGIAGGVGMTTVVRRRMRRAVTQVTA